jgi:hypothetical protein
VPRFSSNARKANRSLVDLIGEIAARKKVTPAQIALAWPLAQKPWNSGYHEAPPARRKYRRRLVLTGNDCGAIAGVLARVSVQGDRYPAHLQARVGR